MEAKKMKISAINALDDGCLMRILAFLSPLPDRFNAARVCSRWRALASDPRFCLRVDSSPSPNALSHPTLQHAITAARYQHKYIAIKMVQVFVFCHASSIGHDFLISRPGDTILIAAGGVHMACNIQMKKPLCLVGGGSLPDDTVLVCPRGYDSALEFLATGKVSNLTIEAELGSCLLHRNGRLTVENCVLQCKEHPLEHLCCPIVSTAEALPFPSAGSIMVKRENCVSVIHTRIEGGAKAVISKGSLTLQQVRVIYARTALFFWFDVAQRRLADIDVAPFACKA